MVTYPQTFSQVHGFGTDVHHAYMDTCPQVLGHIVFMVRTTLMTDMHCRKYALNSLEGAL